jgi:hypothetical protein
MDMDIRKSPLAPLCQRGVVPLFTWEGLISPPFLKGDKGGLDGVFQKAKVLQKTICGVDRTKGRYGIKCWNEG